MNEWLNCFTPATQHFCCSVRNISVMEMILKQGPTHKKPMKCVQSFGLVTEIDALDNDLIWLEYMYTRVNRLWKNDFKSFS
jgi:hypothetical protein